MAETRSVGGGDAAEAWDHSTRRPFLDYYATQSESAATHERFVSLQRMVLRLLGNVGRPLEVADLGCGAGTQSLIWAAAGHRVHGLDVSADLVALAGRRAAEAGFEIDFRIGSVTRLPWADGSTDVCLVVELLEHLADWETCLDECVRVLRPGGLLLITTTNKLCPVQQEFSLPLYSWYPRRLKRRYERLAVTTRPEIVGHATYPAVNWFSFYSLRRALGQRGCRSRDRFDVMDLAARGPRPRAAVAAIRAVPVLRWLAHVMTPSTWVIAVKQ